MEDNLEAQRTSPASRREEFDKIEAACREALGESAPIDLVIGPMVALVDQGLTIGTIVNVLLSESRRKRSKPIRTWKIWADIVVEKLADAPKLNGYANGASPANDTKIDMGSFLMPESDIVRLIEKHHEPAYLRAIELDFGKVEFFRQKVASRAPHLMKFWPDEPRAAQ